MTGRKSLIYSSVTTINPQTGEEVETPITEAIIQAIEIGAYVEDAAQAVGITKATIYNWLARGEEHKDAEKIPAREQPFVDFLDEITRARARATIFHLANIHRHALADWRASQFYLAVTHPERYAKNRLEIEHKGSVTTRTELDLSALSDSEVDELEALMEKASTNGDGG